MIIIVLTRVMSAVLRVGFVWVVSGPHMYYA